MNQKQTMLNPLSFETLGFLALALTVSAKCYKMLVSRLLFLSVRTEKNLCLTTKNFSFEVPIATGDTIVVHIS